MRLEIFKGENGLNKIEPEWNELFNNLIIPSYTQSIIWHKSYLKYLAPDVKRCYYFCIYKFNKLVAIFPLENVRHKFYILSINTLSSSSHSHFGINSVIVDEKENTQHLFEFLYHSLKKEKHIAWDLIYFNLAIENSQAALCKIDDQKLCIQRNSPVCDVLPIQIYEETFKKFSRRLKRNLRKGREIISKLNNIEYKSTRNADELKVYYNHFLDTEASGWKGISGEGSAIKLNKNLRSFYLDVLHGFSKNENMEINLLSINGKYIAAQYAIIIEPTVFLLKIGYDEDSRDLSPGNLLIEHKLKEYATNYKLKELNLISDADWHAQWKPIKVSSFKIFNCKNLLVATCLKIALQIYYIYKEIKTKL